jgi:Oxidoreductase family, NAD-binding Rossmann fold
VKKKIGFIDYFIDEFHANNYVGWIRESSRASEFEIALAWEEKAKEDGLNIVDWCDKYGVSKADSIAQVVKECDCLVVLSPDNAEKHEELAELALRSGKPVYVDKTFAPTRAAAERMFALAAECDTPLMTSSALRFAPGLNELLRDADGVKINSAVTFGGGRSIDIYGVHQLEMIVKVLGPGAEKVLAQRNGDNVTMLISYPDERSGVLHFMPGQFEIILQHGSASRVSSGPLGDFFPCFIENMLDFFSDGIPRVPGVETIEIIALIESGSQALTQPGNWIKL